MPVGQVEVANLIKPDYKQPIDVIVTTHNHFEVTVKCVNALYRNTIAPFHLIAIDDSTDLTPTYFEWLQREHKNITFIHSEQPYKSGNQILNIGLQHGNSEFAAIVTNSVAVEPEWEIAALDLLSKNPNWGIVGLKCLFPWGLIESAGIAMAGFIPVDLGRNLAGHRLSNVYECEAVQWAFTLLRKKAIGKLEEDVYNGFKGWDDIDNCFVVRNNGWKVFYCGLGVGYHTPRATRGSNTQESHILTRQNAERFYKRWGYWEQYKKANPTIVEFETLIPEKPLPIIENRAARRRRQKALTK